MTLVVFAPNATAPFQFQPTLDGELYTAIISWNLAGQRWYVNLYTLNGGLVFYLPLIGSPPDYDINMAGGYFTTSTFVFRQSSQTFEVFP